jgi:hypothetical protein
MSTITHTLLSAGGEPMEAVTARMTHWCRRWSAKDLARLLDVSPRTAEGWRCGNWPQGRHLTAMVAEWGTDWLVDIYRPVAEDAALDRRLEAVEAMIANIKEDYRHAHPAPSGPTAAPGAYASGRVARPRGALLATARALIIGVVLGAGALHALPQLPDTVAGLAHVADEPARVPRGGGAKRAVARLAVRSARREG